MRISNESASVWAAEKKTKTLVWVKLFCFVFFGYVKIVLRYVLDLLSQGLSHVSILPAVGQRMLVVTRYAASSYG